MTADKKTKVRETQTHTQGLGGGPITATRVVEVPKGAEITGDVVPDDTPVTDWQAVENN